MGVDVLGFYNRNKEIIDALNRGNWLGLFILFFINRNGPLDLKRLHNNIGLPSNTLEQSIAWLAGNNLITIGQSLLSLTESGEEILQLLKPASQRTSWSAYEPIVYPKITVVGVGGAGCNIVNHMINEKIRGVRFVAVNTDAQSLVRSEAPVRIRIGDKLTKGLGTGGDAEKGLRAALESRDDISEALQDSDMVIITAGMGGGSGTGAAPVIADLARTTGALTVALVTRPFTFEGPKRQMVADEGIRRLKDRVDAFIVVPLDRLLDVVENNLPLDAAFRVADDALGQSLRAISEVITVPGGTSAHFADVRAILSQAGPALMATIGWGKGENRATDAARAAIYSPLLDVSIEGARGVLFNICGGPNLTLHEVSEAADIIVTAADPDATIIFGTVIDPAMEDEIKITIVAAGFPTADTKVVPADNNIRQLKLSLPRADADDLDIPPFLRRITVRLN